MRRDKKYDAMIKNGDNVKTISFGGSGYEDYTIHRDDKRKERYINRHEKREDWSINGLYTAGFYSRWILWFMPSIELSISMLNKKYPNVRFKYEK